MKTTKIIYWIATAIMCAIFLFSAFMYLTKYEMVQGFYAELNFPDWMIYPLAIAKILAVIAIVSRRSTLLKEWAYAGLFFDALMATAAHHFAGDGIIGLSLLVLVLVLASRFLEDKAFV